jgi:hypothetical protein
VSEASASDTFRAAGFTLSSRREPQGRTATRGGF